MLKLNAGFSRKVGEPNYGSRGASVNVELELESNLISDPEGLLRRIQGLFDIARRSVDEELATDRSRDNGRNSIGYGHTDNTRNERNTRCATTSQVRAIHAICKRQGVDAAQLANSRFRVSDLEELSLQEASTLIDELKAAPTSRTNGGGR